MNKPAPPPMQIAIKGSIFLHPRGLPTVFAKGSEDHKAYLQWKALPMWRRVIETVR